MYIFETRSRRFSRWPHANPTAGTSPFPTLQRASSGSFPGFARNISSRRLRSIWSSRPDEFTQPPFLFHHRSTQRTAGTLASTLVKSHNSHSPKTVELVLRHSSRTKKVKKEAQPGSSIYLFSKASWRCNLLASIDLWPLLLSRRYVHSLFPQKLLFRSRHRILSRQKYRM